MIVIFSINLSVLRNLSPSGTIPTPSEINQEKEAETLGNLTRKLIAASRWFPAAVIIYNYIAICHYYGLCSMHAGIENLADITIYFHSLGRTAVFNLGLVLGLDYNRLKPLIDSINFLADMLAGWLQRVDQVQKVGVPTWRRLVEALRDPRVGKNGIASEIEQDKQ